MNLHAVPKAERVHIALFGKRNAGKSSVINALTGQNLAVVSDTKGTTTDPVYKAMELLPLGPVVMIDTPGLDDTGELGKLRVHKAMQVLQKSDIALLICDINEPFSEFEQTILEKIRKKGIPHLIVLNQSDRYSGDAEKAAEKLAQETGAFVIPVSAHTKQNIHALKEKIACLIPSDESGRLLGDKLQCGDIVVLVVPIDSAAPKGRLILPQQQVLREVLDCHGIAAVTQAEELSETLDALGRKPKLVITDSQAFARVSADTPSDIPLTSFSILFARYKGELETLVAGAKALNTLEDGDSVLIAEGCTHHRQCDDIGTVKIPRWVREYTRKRISFTAVSGTEFPDDLSEYKMIVHCGGCMLNSREMRHRIAVCMEQDVPIVNYGVLIAAVTGILRRSLEPFADELDISGL